MKKLLLIGALVLTASFANAQSVNIPDANFKAYLVGNTLINTNGDTEIQVSEATAFVGAITCDGLNISDLTGIEAFTALTELYINNNQLTSLDVSNNTALIYFECPGNQLTSLDVSQNTALEFFFCSLNQLTSLDVTNNTALYRLDCDDNQLTSLDVSQNTALALLYCHENNLTSLDVTNNTALYHLKCYNNQLACLNVNNGNNTNFFIFNALNNPNLTCIEVDDATYSTANWTNIDAQTSFSENCNNACSSSALGINEFSNTPKELVNIVDLMGRETTAQKNKVLIYVYSNGTTERVFEFE